MIAFQVMSAVRASCPEVHLTIVEGLSPKPPAGVLSGEIDLAVV